AGSGRAADPLPLLEERAVAVALRDRVVADQRAVDVADLPAAEPEIELRGFGHPAARVNAGADALHDPLETRIAAKRLERGVPLDHFARPRADVIRDVERVERLGVAPERGEVERALDLDHRLGRERGARGL